MLASKKSKPKKQEDARSLRFLHPVLCLFLGGWKYSTKKFIRNTIQFIHSMYFLGPMNNFKYASGELFEKNYTEWIDSTQSIQSFFWVFCVVRVESTQTNQSKKNKFPNDGDPRIICGSRSIMCLFLYSYRHFLLTFGYTFKKWLCRLDEIAKVSLTHHFKLFTVRFFLFFFIFLVFLKPFQKK